MFNKLFSLKGSHVNVAHLGLRQVKAIAFVLLLAEVLLLGYGVSGCSKEPAKAEVSIAAELKAPMYTVAKNDKLGVEVKAEKSHSTTITNIDFVDKLSESYVLSLPRYKDLITKLKERKYFLDSVTVPVTKEDTNISTEPIDPTTIKTYLTEEEMADTIAMMEPVALTWEEMYSEEYLAELKATNLPEYLALLPWISTKPENVWIDTSDKSQDDPDWLPGLKVSKITADMMTIPEWMTEDEFKHVVTMLAHECGNAENDEVFMYTGGVLMNRIWYDTYFINKYGGIDGQLTAPGQYTGLYVQEAGYQRATEMPCFDHILRNAYLVVNGYYNMPKNVSFQAEFVQGKGCWKAIHIATDYWNATEYFCYTLTQIDGCD